MSIDKDGETMYWLISVGCFISQCIQRRTWLSFTWNHQYNPCFSSDLATLYDCHVLRDVLEVLGSAVAGVEVVEAGPGLHDTETHHDQAEENPDHPGCGSYDQDVVRIASE